MTGFWSSETMRTRFVDERLVAPFDSNRIENCAYELSMGPQALLTGGDRTRHDLDEGEEFRIPPGQFAQLLTEERIRIPCDALGLISMKSRVKSLGLVNVSGFHVDPGFAGRLRFSVYNAGPSPVRISRGTRVFLIWYASLDSPTLDLYQGEGGRDEFDDDDAMGMQGDVSTPQALADRVVALEKKFGVRERIWWILVGAVVTLFISVFGLRTIDAVTSDDSSNTPAPQSQSQSHVE
ncbi:dCTP deaminase [Candidatus Poriferisodalis sp.]|uniref:dCTP deaminase n=1 Tax=Candidatus Poriferisodalis sp. TaxID=3101277 RepID=UPI003B596DA3